MASSATAGTSRNDDEGDQSRSIDFVTVDSTAKFMYDRKQQIGDQSGEHGAVVYKGYFNGTIPIALKRYQNIVKEEIIKSMKRDLDVHSSPGNRHPNFIRYFGYAEDHQFRYLAFELCECSVADIVDPKRKEKAEKKINLFSSIIRNLQPKEILRQSNEAVNFLHSLKRIHRNLHPDNFLISCIDPNKEHFLIKLTDFRHSKNWVSDPNLTGTLGSRGWVAPESLLVQDDLHPIAADGYKEDHLKIDAFIMGCYYFYVLSGGKHPFGDGIDERRGRIKTHYDGVYQDNWDGGLNWTHYSNLHQEEASVALSLIKKVLKFEPSPRTSLTEIANDSFFRSDHPYHIYDHPISKIPGLCVIITQSIYHNPRWDLGTGVLVDAKKLEEIYFKFGYQVLHYKNLRAAQLEEFLSLENLAKENGGSLDQFASLVVCILGHGDKGVVFGVDCAPVLLNQLQYAFNTVTYPALVGKPKVFVILACQGSHDQLIYERPDPSRTYYTLTMMPPINNSSLKSPTMPPLMDFLSLMSTIEEFRAWLTSATAGSEFISSLCDALECEYNVVDTTNKRDLAQLFSSVVIPRVGRFAIPEIIELNNGQTQETNRTIKQTPEFRSSLTKTIRFRSYPVGVRPRLVHDGEKLDPSFKHGRNYYESLGYKKK